MHHVALNPVGGSVSLPLPGASQEKKHPAT